ncbi:hypothetical protein OG897_27390 [Streptomyces sp. NBC_00237]|uniref:hypothetical protein n=1 Tax=Streptomyces sp. NBC_00237 TaxID=2975687 RepID=UPI0022564BBA|nr:hypothetical protein [Streptomyces sp. NBC_00237]MCX5205168.1 hypothetical protein [Streptomyces sp. NBC_00237]
MALSVAAVAAAVTALAGCTVDRSGYDGTRQPTGRSDLENPDRVDVLRSRAESKGRIQGLLLRNAKIEKGIAPEKAIPDEAECTGAWRLRGHEATVGEGNLDVFVLACTSVPAASAGPTPAASQPG